MKLGGWQKKEKTAPALLPVLTVADVLNTYRSLCYVSVGDVALDSLDRFWLRRSAVIQDGPFLPGNTKDWIPVSGFAHGGKVHSESDRNWDRIPRVLDPDPDTWARVRRTGE